jgi:hypothetical protein
MKQEEVQVGQLTLNEALALLAQLIKIKEPRKMVPKQAPVVQSTTGRPGPEAAAEWKRRVTEVSVQGTAGRGWCAACYRAGTINTTLTTCPWCSGYVHVGQRYEFKDCMLSHYNTCVHKYAKN